MKHSFTAIDFETAQGYRWSICQVGLVKIENSAVQQVCLICSTPAHHFHTVLHSFPEYAEKYPEIFAGAFPLMLRIFVSTFAGGPERSGMEPSTSV